MVSNNVGHFPCKFHSSVWKASGKSKTRFFTSVRFQVKNNVIIASSIIFFSILINVIEANVPHSNPPNDDNTFVTSGPNELDLSNGRGSDGSASDNESGGSIPSVATYKPRANIPDWNSTGNENNDFGNFDGLSPIGHSSSTGHSTPDETVTEVKDLRYAVASFDFHHVATPYIISLWIIIVGLAKIGFHVTPKLSSICPESVVLMILGVVIGIILFYGGIDKPGSVSSIIPPGQSPESLQPTFQQPLTPNIFFLYMLPPIVMDAGYHMPNRLFFDNLCSILLYAVLGTIWNALTIGLCLYGCAATGLFGVELPLLDTLLFSSIVSAVDPVAVLAVFEEIHVNEVLYILVFGESLLNDAVTVVLYHMFEGYTEMGKENILAVDYIAGFASFFVIALGGTFMGVIWGFAAAFVSRFTHHVKIIEPIFVFVMAYLSYLSAEMFHLSGILALTFCGITMKNYVEENITETSQTTLKYAMKMLANSSESVIFLFLGVCTVTDTHDWNTMFVILTIVFALVFRALGVIIFTAIANRFRLHKLTGIEQFIMSYGGLRGAVAFALVLVVNEHIIPTKKMMVTTIIAIVYFTVFLQGMTIGPLVKILKVPRANKFEMSMNERIHNRLMDHTMAGIEDISGMMIGNYKIRDKFRHLNNQFLKHWFLRDSHERGNSSRKIFETYSRLNLQDAINIVNQGSNKPSPNNIYSNNNNSCPSEKTLSQLFRTFTESNLSTGGGDQAVGTSTNDKNSGTFTSLCLESPTVPTFNFDLANLDYSPTHRDMAEAEIHHILTDNLFKPVRRFRKYSKCDLPESSENHPAAFQHMARVQMRTLMSQNLKKRQRLKQQKSRSDLKSSSGGGPMGGHHHPVSHVSYLSPDRALNGTRLTVPNGNVRARSEPPISTKPQLYQLTENEGEGDGGIVFTVNSGTKENPGGDPQFPILDINSGGVTREDRSVSDVHKRLALQGHDNDGYTGFDDSVSSESGSSIEKGRKSPGKPRSSGGQSNATFEADDEAPKTSAESTLPWRRDSASNQPDSDMARGHEVADYDRSSMALKQEEFPPWITNKDYLPSYASPTNTLLAEIDRKNSMHKTPSVYEIFTIADSPEAEASGGEPQETSSSNLTKGTDQKHRVQFQSDKNSGGASDQRTGQTKGGNSTKGCNPPKSESTTVTISLGKPQSTTIDLEPSDTSRL